MKINSLKRISLKRIMINWKTMLTHYYPVLSFYTPHTWNIRIWLVFWWYQKATLGSNGLKKAMFKGTGESLCCIKDFI